MVDKSVMVAENGKFRTRSLFLELSEHPEKYQPLYTLKDDDVEHDVYGKLPSAKRIYLSVGDPTEYKAALALVGSWRHWQALTKSSAFAEYLNEWREELEVLLRSNAVGQLIAVSREGSRGVPAAKWLSEAGWNPVKKRGRPSSAEVARERKVAARVAKMQQDDADRVREALNAR